ADFGEPGAGVAVQPDQRLVAQIGEGLALAGVEELLGVLVAEHRHQLAGRLRLRHAQHGGAGISSSACSQPKNCCSPLCLFSAGAADRVSIIHAWNASTWALVTTVGSAAPSSASGSGECSARYRASWAAASR